MTKFDNPWTFITSFEKYLTDNGGLKPTGIEFTLEAADNFGLKLVPKCMVLKLLHNSTDTVLSKLCVRGFWNILWKWLQEALKTLNTAFLREILILYQKIPVDLSLITKNQCPKTINTISKESTGDIKILAKSIVKSWKCIFQTLSKSPNPINQTIPPVSQKETSKKSRPIGASIKTLPSQMRTAGVETDSKPVVKSRADVLKDKAANLLNRQISDKNISISNGIQSDQSSNQSLKNSPPTSVPEKRKIYEVKESSTFLDSLNAAAVKDPPKKKKRSNPVKNPIPSSSNDISSPVNHTSISADESPNVLTSPSDTADTSENVRLKSSIADIDSLLSVDKRRKKSVSWAIDNSLISIKYFDLDETERVNVNRLTMDEMRRLEHSHEKSSLSQARTCVGESLLDANGTGELSWRPPVLVICDPTSFQPGSQSTERVVQAEREKNVLQQLYLTRESIPDSPAEPDICAPNVGPAALASASNGLRSEPVLIPLFDKTVSGPFVESAKVDVVDSKDANANADQASILITSQHNDGKTQIALEPQLADLVKTIACNLSQSSMSLSHSSGESFPDPSKIDSRLPTDFVMPPNAPIMSSNIPPPGFTHSSSLAHPGFPAFRAPLPNNPGWTPRRGVFKSQVCKNYAQGNCYRGESCHFAHTPFPRGPRQSVRSRFDQ